MLDGVQATLKRANLSAQSPTCRPEQRWYRLQAFVGFVMRLRRVRRSYSGETHRHSPTKAWLIQNCSKALNKMARAKRSTL